MVHQILTRVGVFAPILLARFLPSKMNIVLITLKQFGTGIIVATAFIHVSYRINPSSLSVPS